MKNVVRETSFTEIGTPKRGKVRDIYDLGDSLLIVASDRISAFDVVLPGGIEDKGKVLNKLSVFWFRQIEHLIGNHILETDAKKYPAPLNKYSDVLQDRSMIVRKAKSLPAECVVRGYLAGSGWKEYQEKGSVCGIALARGLVESSKLENPIFTPTTKADEGHDLNMSFEELEKNVGNDRAAQLRDMSIRIYENACALAQKRGIIIADTKFEFGMVDDEMIIIDEVLTPDSSRFWSMKTYKPGFSQDSYDKQIVRDYLNTLDWDKTYPGPQLPEEISRKARERYIEILTILTGEGL
jgi:phosphoribosylaminoimidazole-succinocarboxamide synthase